MESEKFSSGTKRKFGKYPLLIVIEFLSINEQLLMINFNKNLRTKILNYYQCKILKNYLLEWGNFLENFKVNKPEEIIEKLSDNRFKAFMANIYIRVADFSYKEKIQLEETLLSKYLNHNKSFVYITTNDNLKSVLFGRGINIIFKLANLSSLAFKNTRNNKVIEQGYKIIEEFSQLKSNENNFIDFTIKLYDLSNDGFKILGEVLVKYPRKAIHLEDVESKVGLKTLMEAVKNNSTLKILKITITGYYMDQEDCTIITDLVKSNKYLKSFCLSRQNNINYGYTILGEVLNNNTILQEIEITDYLISRKGFRLLAKALENNHSLLSINLNRNNIGERVCKFLAKALEKNSTLQTLNLSNNHVTAKGIDFLADGLEKNSSLISLHLGENKINSDGCKVLGEFLKNNKSLKNLNLEYNEITPKGCRWLANGLIQNVSLTSINLNNSFINNEGMKILLETLMINSTLQKINLSGNENINDIGIVLMEEALQINSTLITIKFDRSSDELEGLICLKNSLKMNTTIKEIIFYSKIDDTFFNL